VVHRELKPVSVMVNASGQVKILDFGLAAVLQGLGVTTSLAAGRLLADQILERPAIPVEPYLPGRQGR
jgi:serine/threonine protein kinase